MRRRTAVFILAAGVLILALPPQIARGEVIQHKNQLVIESAIADLPGLTLQIHGRNFHRGTEPVVTLGDFQLAVTSYTESEISVELPTLLMDGDYLLAVSTGPGTQKFDVHGLTVGEAGPQGEKGDKGAQGDRGVTGLAPAHEWSGTELRFVNWDGTWGSSSDFQGPGGARGAHSGGTYSYQTVSYSTLGPYGVREFDAKCDTGYAAAMSVATSNGVSGSRYPYVQGGTIWYHGRVQNTTSIDGLVYHIRLICQH